MTLSDIKLFDLLVAFHFQTFGSLKAIKMLTRHLIVEEMATERNFDFSCY